MLLVTFLTCNNQYLAVALITIGQSVSDLAFTGGYLLTYLDMAPQYAGLLTGISNTIGSVAGVIVPTLVGIITPDVSIHYIRNELTNTMAYGTRRFNAAFTRALQKFLS